MSLTLEQIAATIDAKRLTHPELSRPLTWPGFARICGREGVQLRVRKSGMARPAQLVPFAGEWTIIISGTTPHRRYTYHGAHELGHLWLHHDRAAERWERVYNMDSTWEADPREDDAELFASLVLMGPVRSSPWVPKAQPMQPQLQQRSPEEIKELMRQAESSLQFALRMARGGKPPRRRR